MDMTLRRTRFPRGRRWSLIGGYLCAGSAGGVAVWSGLSGPVGDLLGWVSLVWAGFMLAGGVLSAWGQVTQRWMGERVGLIALFFSSWFLGVVLGVVGVMGGRSTSIALALLLGYCGFLSYGRWQTVRRFAEDDRHRPTGEGTPT